MIAFPGHRLKRKMEAVGIHGASEGLLRKNTVNHNYEYDGCLAYVITQRQRVMKLIDFPFCPCYKRGSDVTAG